MTVKYEEMRFEPRKDMVAAPPPQNSLWYPPHLLCSYATGSFTRTKRLKSQDDRLPLSTALKSVRLEAFVCKFLDKSTSFTTCVVVFNLNEDKTVAYRMRATSRVQDAKTDVDKRCERTANK